MEATFRVVKTMVDIRGCNVVEHLDNAGAWIEMGMKYREQEQPKLFSVLIQVNQLLNTLKYLVDRCINYDRFISVYFREFKLNLLT